MKKFLAVTASFIALSTFSLALGEESAAPPAPAETSSAVESLQKNAEKNEDNGKSAEALRRNALRKQEKDEAKLKRKALRAEAKAEKKARKAKAKADRKQSKTE